jgi:hypothetical protein
LVGGRTFVFDRHRYKKKPTPTTLLPQRVRQPNCAGLTTNATQSVTVGSPISDTATLSDATNNAGGTITFKVYGPNDAKCAGTAAYTKEVNASGNGDYGPGEFTPTEVGTYRGTADYSGDANNKARGVSVMGSWIGSRLPASGTNIQKYCKWSMPETSRYRRMVL